MNKKHGKFTVEKPGVIRFLSEPSAQGYPIREMWTKPLRNRDFLLLVHNSTAPITAITKIPFNYINLTAKRSYPQS